ncbi:MAG: hypothetical protein AB8B69_08650 [Chitinophagales bacterium]
MDNPKSICIIPARGGSKRIPRKNVLPLNGVPLLAYTIRAARDAKVFDEILVSTEDEEIKQVALNEGVGVDDRPMHMAGDKVTKVQVVKEYIGRTNAMEKYDIIAALLPTCPFRTAEDVRAAYELFIGQSVHSFLVGVVAYDFPIQLALSLEENEQVVSMLDSASYLTTRSQDIAKRYHPNGAMYIATIDAFLKKGTFFNEAMLAYVMSAEKSFDIDYPYQFEIAEAMAKRLKIK